MGWQRCSNGKRKPVRLVKTVVTRKIAVQPSSRFPTSRPYTTMNPEPIPDRLGKRCTRVNVDIVMPKIISPSFRMPKLCCREDFPTAYAPPTLAWPESFGYKGRRQFRSVGCYQ